MEADAGVSARHPAAAGLVATIARAGKRVEGGRYVFEVEFAVPLLGRVPSYGGDLQASPEPSAQD
ncbi:hypothetical protein B1810_15725 [Panacagrimonas perspica]|uniref:hypothetical protein n=1 Tax=Panacagrimonas perspica TaxID=381431 RepID=UPI00105E859E|nr:hypothetical protein [Panacagrimonas perspica]THD02367.1 hypothetical protein B1810_15725 [Panacagrimonas perspica]